MGRLIDASELIEIIKGNENLIELQKEELIECVNACDTAYDVDAVVKQLEKRKQTHERCIDYEKKNGTVTEEFQQRKAVEVLKDAIEVVKSGGVNAEYTSSNSDDITRAVEALDTFTKNWCMNCEETKKQNDLIFRCEECEFKRKNGRCKIKEFVFHHKHDFPIYKFGCMSR